jgi:hypothetical protein
MNLEVPTFALPDPTWKVVDAHLPKPGKLVKYRTALYQLLGYVDLTGRWVATDGREEQLPVKAWREISDPLSISPERTF